MKHKNNLNIKYTRKIHEMAFDQAGDKGDDKCCFYSAQQASKESSQAWAEWCERFVDALEQWEIAHGQDKYWKYEAYTPPIVRVLKEYRQWLEE